MTLKELAIELRKIFKCTYVTVEYKRGQQQRLVCLWKKDGPTSPVFSEQDKEWLNAGDSPFEFSIYEKSLFKDLDLSEYKDENGDIDYSKCIVEVE